jgi:hypothetical protein
MWYVHAGETVRLSASVKYMLLEVGGDYDNEVDVVYNSAKTVYMIIHPKYFAIYGFRM